MAKLTSEEVAFAIIGIIPLIGLLSLFLKKDSMFVQFYAKQGVILLGVYIINSIITWIIPPLGWIISVGLGIIIIIAIVKIVMGELWKIPYVFNLSKNLG